MMRAKQIHEAITRLVEAAQFDEERIAVIQDRLLGIRDRAELAAAWIARRPRWVFAAWVVIFVLGVWLIPKCTGVSPTDAILFLTGVIIIWYTVETHAMRRETTRHNAIQVQPFLFVTGIWPDSLVLQNMGRGVALHVLIDDIRFLTDETTSPEYVARFRTTDVIASGSTAHVKAQLIQIRGEASQPISSLASQLDPEFQRRYDFAVVISYEDIHGGEHRTRLTMGMSGTWLVDYE
jgi:hypothetical protein